MDRSRFENKKEWAKFGTGLALISGLLAVIQFILGRELWLYPLGAAFVFLLISRFFPILLKPVYILFSYLGLVMGWVMTRVILTILYYLVLTPLSLTARLLGKKFLDTGFRTHPSSYWVSIQSARYDRRNYEKQF